LIKVHRITTVGSRNSTKAPRDLIVSPRMLIKSRRTKTVSPCVLIKFPDTLITFRPHKASSQQAMGLKPEAKGPLACGRPMQRKALGL
jgi:hypothetical protein